MSGTGGSKTNLENNIVDDSVLENIPFECDEELPPTGIREESIGSGPFNYICKNNKQIFSVLSTVSKRFMEVIRNLCERIFGEDYWIPSDPFKVTLGRTYLGYFFCWNTLRRFGASGTFFSGKKALSEALQSKGTTIE